MGAGQPEVSTGRGKWLKKPWAVVDVLVCGHRADEGTTRPFSLDHKPIQHPHSPDQGLER